MPTHARLAAGLALLLPLATLHLEGPDCRSQQAGPSAAVGGKFFSGTSAGGNVQEALDAALEAARTSFAKHENNVDFRWELASLGGRRATAPDARSLTVSIRITRGAPAALEKKDGPGATVGGGGF